MRFGATVACGGGKQGQGHRELILTPFLSVLTVPAWISLEFVARASLKDPLSSGESPHRGGETSRRRCDFQNPWMQRRIAHVASTVPPSSAPIPAVTPIAKALQNVTRITPLATFASPT